jgi:hypothetical protein
VLLDWGSKRQKLVAISTGEAETDALNTLASIVSAAMRSVIPLTMLVNQATNREVKTTYFVDSDACRRGVANFRNTLMKYINKTRDIHLCWLHEQTSGEHCQMVRVATDDNVADIFTKPLNVEPFVRHRTTLGVLPL